MGACTWLTGESWPLPETETRTLFLASDKSRRSCGAMGPPGRRGAGTDEFIADPHNPVQSLGGDLATHDPVCVDQRAIECRADVLVYSTPVLTEPVAIAGDVSAELYVSADVEDADVFVKLVDVYPDGTAYNLADSCLRLRYRDGFDEPTEAGTRRDLPVPDRGITTANYFPAGHGSASRSPAPTSRSRTATGTPATAMTWPPTARWRTSPCTTAEGHESALLFGPTPARSRSTRRCSGPVILTDIARRQAPMESRTSVRIPGRPRLDSGSRPSRRVVEQIHIVGARPRGRAEQACRRSRQFLSALAAGKRQPAGYLGLFGQRAVDRHGQRLIRDPALRPRRSSFTSPGGRTGPRPAVPPRPAPRAPASPAATRPGGAPRWPRPGPLLAPGEPRSRSSAKTQTARVPARAGGRGQRRGRAADRERVAGPPSGPRAPPTSRRRSPCWR